MKPLANQIDDELRRIGVLEAVWHWYAFRKDDDTYYVQMWPREGAVHTEIVCETSEFIQWLSTLPPMPLGDLWRRADERRWVFARVPGTEKPHEGERVTRELVEEGL